MKKRLTIFLICYTIRINVWICSLFGWEHYKELHEWDEIKAGLDNVSFDIKLLLQQFKTKI